MLIFQRKPYKFKYKTMKKFLLTLAVSVALLSSCATVRTATSKSADVSTSVSSVTMADLDIANKKIEYVYTPTKKERKKLKSSTLMEKAVAAALKSNNNADVMVASQFEIEQKGAMRRIRKITVTGYPATYKNFKSVINN